MDTHRINRLLLGRGRYCLVGMALLTILGCGKPYGTYQGDPALGNFNRPIAPTPPVMHGGDPGMTPAYDGGARLGMPSPDVPNYAPFSGSARGSWIAPTGISFGSRMQGGTDSSESQGLVVGVGGNRRLTRGAKLPLQEERKPFIAATKPGSFPTANGVVFRNADTGNYLTSGSAIAPDTTKVAANSTFNPVKPPIPPIHTAEEGQILLTSYGAKNQQIEQHPTGEWIFTCVVPNPAQPGEQRRYEARHASQVEAIKAVVHQVRVDMP